MAETDKVFTGSIPDIYDEYLVPLIFEAYATDIAKRVASNDPQAILETAAGSGVVTRALAPLLSAGTRYCVTDLNQPMLDRAAKVQGNDNRIEWTAADALSLPFEDSSFDVVCCQFGVMFFPDRTEGYAEARRVLKPGGRFIFNAWDNIKENEFADVVTKAAGEVFADDPPYFLARTPHGYADVGEIEADLRAAGFNDISIETITEVSSAASARIPAIAYCEGTPLRNEIEERDAALLNHVVDHATQAIAERFGEGPVAAKIQGHVATAAS
ncbi:class I SAM-dependent methyltransferase [Ruegeria sp. 6PALISEP08]|uniref:class I SAM-dependent methyltransferase n=1 Tax=Ruegeria sp. 6PALISEP08 TaxID=1225660 RepID=UPI00067F2FE3|nr:methyltransferase domain-containing protein [Ruegeria sp. 6PALISEP08]